MPLATVILFTDYLIREVDNDIFHDNLDEHSRLKQKLHEVFATSKINMKTMVTC